MRSIRPATTTAVTRDRQLIPASESRLEMPTPTPERLQQLESKLAERRKFITSWLSGIQEQRGEHAELTIAESEKLRQMNRDLRQLDDQTTEYRSELERVGTIPAGLLKRTQGRVGSAGLLSPLGYGDEQLRRAFEQVNRGETAVLETRDPGFTTATPFVPPDLGPVLPVFPRHENRLLDRLPGISIDVPALAYVEVVSVTGTAAVVAEGAAKPELLMPADQKVATARKIACHVGVSWETYSGDYPAFVTAVQSELLRAVVDAENLQLYAGTGEANGQVNGLSTAANILTFTATGGGGPNPEYFTDLAGAIATLRTGPALADPNLCLMHPNTWANVRTAKDQYGRFLASVDPTSQTAETVWDVPVLVSTQFTAGTALLVDTTLYGRAVIREPIVTRIGFSGTDFTQNIVRFVSEERLTQTIERPQAICKITGLPTAAPSEVEETKSSKSSK